MQRRVNGTAATISVAGGSMDDKIVAVVLVVIKLARHSDYYCCCCSYSYSYYHYQESISISDHNNKHSNGNNF